MICRRHFMGCLFFLFSSASILAAAQDDSTPFDCHVNLPTLRYDLSALKGEQIVARDRNSPPTRMRDSVRFNLCDELKEQDGVSAEDQCPPGTRACLTTTNLKGSEGDRIVAVVPLANSTIDDSQTRSLPSPNKGVSLAFKGSSYPDPVTSEPIPQLFRINVLCSTELFDPKFVSYDNKEMQVEWSAPAGCPMAAPHDGEPSSDPDREGGGKEDKAVGSGIGYFFLLLLLAFIAYFGLGAYYNYSTYGASGVDLIPHRDFWREVPYMLRDVVSHLCSVVRPRSRGGYVAV